MRFHVPALPGRSIARSNSTCAYSGYVRKFARMMLDRGHEVFVYSGPADGEPIGSEYVACYPELSEPLPFDAPEAWAPLNARAVAAIARRAGPGDFLCLTVGTDQRMLIDALPDLIPVESRVGYGGTVTEHRVFETYAWMHVVYGAHYGAHTADGLPTDAVILPPFELEDFPAGDGSGGYLLYLGRMLERKGVFVAAEIAAELDVPLFLAGEGDDVPGYGEHIGSVGPEDRAELLGNAIALLAPTQYVEPGGGAAIEAQLCGTPAITTDWGCYVETVEHGVSGFRCRSSSELADAVAAAPELDRERIRARARSRHSLEVIGELYERYFERLRGQVSRIG